MFTLEQIKAEFAKVRSGADFPALIAGFKQIGIAGYEHHVADGITLYNNGVEGTLTTPARYKEMPVNTSISVEALKGALAVHQRGDADYLTFCRQAANAGVDKWVVNTGEMTCTYYGANGTEMLCESIPG